MTNVARKYGTGPMQLIMKRLPKAYYSFGLSLLATFIPAVLFVAYDVVLPVWVYLICAIVAVTSCRKGLYWDKRIAQARQGGKAEDQVGRLLERLPGDWKREHSVYFDKFGDVDFVVTSPHGRVFVIDVKSHDGIVSCATGKVCVLDRKTFEGSDSEFVYKAKQQAELISLSRSAVSVEAMLVFTRADLPDRVNVVDGVTIVSSATLLDFLRHNSKPIKARSNVPHIDADARNAVVKILGNLPEDWIWRQQNSMSDYATPDFLVISPEGRGSVINVKTKFGRIRRRIGTHVEVTMDELLRHTRRHAATTRGHCELSWVNGVVVRYDADSPIKEQFVENVHIVRPHELARLLENTLEG